jgi:taurine dioxygenase
MLSVRKLPGRFGAEIEGLDLRQPLDRATAKALIDVFHENRIIAIRGQQLAFEDFDRVTREFGEQKPHFLDHLRMDGHPAILMLSNIHKNGKPIGVYEGAAFWHTDVAYEDPPNSSTVV